MHALVEAGDILLIAAQLVEGLREDDVEVSLRAMGEIFYLADLGTDCAEDKVYEFLFVAPALPITGAVGSPTNPLAIK